MSASLLVLLGLGMLVAGGELFMRGAVRIAERLGVSPLMIGLTAGVCAARCRPSAGWRALRPGFADAQRTMG